MKTRLTLAGALAVGLLAAPAAFAAGDPRCNKVGGGAVHTVEEITELTPAGTVAAPVLHDTVEPAVCALPLPK